MSLSLHQVRARINSTLSLQDIDLTVAPGELCVVVGPNGAGKTSLLRAICGELPRQQGDILLDERPIEQWSPAARARSLAVLPQQSTLEFPFTVEEVVQLGRIPHSSSAARNREIVCAALDAFDSLQFRQRLYVNLSGGEKQRVQLARVLAQIWEAEPATPRCLILDEPSASLDLAHQAMVLQRIREVAGQGVAVLIVLHDLNLAAKFASQLLVLHEGRAVARGSAEQVITEVLLKDIFSVQARVEPNPLDGRPMVIM